MNLTTRLAKSFVVVNELTTLAPVCGRCLFLRVEDKGSVAAGFAFAGTSRFLGTRGLYWLSIQNNRQYVKLSGAK